MSQDIQAFLQLHNALAAVALVLEALDAMGGDDVPVGLLGDFNRSPNLEVRPWASLARI